MDMATCFLPVPLQRDHDMQPFSDTTEHLFRILFRTSIEILLADPSYMLHAGPTHMSHADPSHMLVTGMVPDPQPYHSQMMVYLPGATDKYGFNSTYHHQMTKTDPFGKPYNQHHHHPPHHLPPPGSAFFHFKRNPTVKHEMTCLWIDIKQISLKRPCNKIFQTMHEIVSHIAVVHVGGPECTNYTCYWQGCKKKGLPFKKRNHFVNHIRIHTGEKPFSCPFPECGKVFAYSHGFSRHKITHTKFDIPSTKKV